MIGVPSSCDELVDHRQVGRIGHDDDQGLALPPVRNEPVPQHQVGRNRAEQILVDRKLLHVHEIEPVPLGQALRGLVLGAALVGGDGIWGSGI